MNELAKLRDHYDASMELAHKWGLSPRETDFHLCPADRIYEILAYGIPGHFSHWTYGRDYWVQKSLYDYGHSKVYELVINADPAQAFLLEGNSVVENQFVISHVLGHTDFFANNLYFEKSNTAIEHTAAAAAARFRDYELEHGRGTVESFIDDVMTIRYHINPNTRIQDKPVDYEESRPENPYADLFPDEEVMDRVWAIQEELNRQYSFPRHPDRDLVRFIAEHGRLLAWQQDIMTTLRAESLYFLPQMQTKIMNEGWASLIHKCMMHHLDVEDDPLGIEFAQMNSGVVSHRDGPINPYWLGYKLFLRIIEVYGEHTEEEMRNLEFIGSPGWEKALEVREVDNDESFVRNYLDEELCHRLNLFTYGFYFPDKNWQVESVDWEDCRDALVASLTNMKTPVIEVVSSNYKNSGQLYLRHRHDGVDLDVKFVKESLKAVSRLWGRTAVLASVYSGGDIEWACQPDGEVNEILYEEL